MCRKMNILKNKRETFLSLLSFAINLTCFVFVMWQIVNCAIRYFQKPRGTTTSYEKTTDLPFPAITVCGSNSYNEKGLKKCGVEKFQYYNGNWNGNDCNDPLTTFETIAYKLEDLVAALKYKYFNEDNEYFENDPKLLKKLWSQTDNLKYGRCFTLVPTSEHIKLGIQQITFRVSSDVELFFHTPEMFLTTRSEVLQEKPMQSISLGCSYDIGIKRDLFKMINDENICMAHTKYSKDQCAYKEIDKKSLEYFGCTSPYGPNKTKICPNSDIGLNVTKLYEDTIEKHNFSCLNPCSFFSMNAMKTKDNCFTAWSQKKSYINILFQETIKVTTGYYLYNGLTLFAQIGGYIGLGRTIVWAYDKTVAFVEQSKLIFSKHQQKSMIA